MCCNGDGSHYDDDEWCAMSGALRIRIKILMVYTKTYEAERIISMMVKNITWSIGWKDTVHTAGRRNTVDNQRWDACKLYQICKCKFNSNTYNLYAMPLRDTTECCPLQRTSIHHLRFPAWANLHFKPLYPLNQSLCMPSQPLQNFQAKSQTEAHKAIFDYTLARGETLSNSSASCGEGPGDSLNYSIGRPNSFPHAARNHAFDPKNGSCNCLYRHRPRQWGLHFLSTNQVLVSSSNPYPTLNCRSFYIVISPLCNAMKACAANK